MATEITSLKNTTPVGDSNTTNEMVVGKISTYRRSFLIVAGSLLLLLVLIASAGTSSGQHLQSSVSEIAEGNAALLNNGLGRCIGHKTFWCDNNVNSCIALRRKTGTLACVCDHRPQYGGRCLPASKSF